MTEVKRKFSYRWLVIGGAVLVAFLFGLMMGGGSSDSDSQGHASDRPSEPEVWTCSMHPNIQLPKAGKCPICFMDLILLETGSGDDGPRQLSLSESARALARIQTSPVERKFTSREIRMTGRIAVDETRLAYISAWAPGRLDRLYADYTGITVAKGDQLVEIYSPELISAQEELLTANGSLQSLKQSSHPSLRKSIETTVAASREKLRLYGLSKAQIDRLLSSGEPTEQLTIYAPVGGVVIEKHVKEGAYVKTGQKIYTLADLSKLWVLFEAYESDLPWLRYGQTVKFSSRSFPSAHFTGTITFIDPILDPVRRTVQVRAIVDNSDGQLKPNMFVSGVVESTLDSKGDVIDLVSIESLGYASGSSAGSTPPLVIPATAPLLTGTRAIVYVELESDDGALFEGRTIELGPRTGEYYIVNSGLVEGEMVVTNGAFKIDAELQLRAKPSMMSPDGGTAPMVHDHGQMTEPEKSVSIEPAEPVESVDISEAARAALTPVYDSYFEVQMALAGNSHEEALAANKKLSGAISDVAMTLFKGTSHRQWMAIAESLGAAAGHGSETADIAEARDVFNTLSKAVIELNETFGHADRNFYLTHCPMARDNQGADWLQTQDTVWNSFYGAMMLRCGSIKETLGAGATH